jgi:DNA-binding LytR/AlgR family response regulator
LKLVINEDKNIKEAEILINCRSVDENITKIINVIKSVGKDIVGTKEGNKYLIKLNNIFYFDCVDKKTFIYTEKEIFESNLHLYEIENLLENTDFFRATKSTIINLSKIKSIKLIFFSKVEVILENNEKLFVSRHYLPELKNKLKF